VATKPACPVTAPNWSGAGVGAGKAGGLIVLEVTVVLSAWVSMTISCAADGPLLPAVIGFGNFVRYLREFYLRNVPEVTTTAGLLARD
jgi:hypothetical protein